jgi:thiol-disulfide isomerase/thioredoxin
VTILTLVSRAVLALVFGVAGIAKLADRTGTKRTLEAFGLSTDMARRVPPVLPIAELAVALALVPAATARSGAASALLMLGAFSAAAAVALARGRRVECHCFGQLTGGTVGWRTLARNAVLAALAVGVLIAERDRRPPAFGALIVHLDGAELLVWVVGVASIALLGLGAWGFVHLLQGHGRLLLRVDALERRLAVAGAASEPRAVRETDDVGLTPGTRPPVLTPTDIEGGSLSWGDLLAGARPILLLFSSPHCGPCRELLPEVQSWQRGHSEQLRVVIATEGSLDEIRRDTIEFGLADVVVDRGLRLFHAFGAKSTPSGVHIRPDGNIGSFVATGPKAIAALYAQIIASSSMGSAPVASVGLTPGTPVPALPRYTLDRGRRVLADLIRAETLVIFWNPGCGYCRSMRDALRRWERRRSKAAPRLVIISAGDEASVRAEGFESPVLLDPDFSLGRAFGIGGTPMAVLVDAEARIASSVAAGSEAVLALTARNASKDAP